MGCGIYESRPIEAERTRRMRREALADAVLGVIAAAVWSVLLFLVMYI